MGEIATPGRAPRPHSGPIPGLLRGPRRVAALQLRPGGGPAAVPVARLESAGVDLAVLPEYYWVRPDDGDVRDTARHAAEDLEALAALSARLSAVLVGGTIVESRSDGRLYNTAPVFHAGREIGRYRKRRLMPGEAAAGLGTGDDTPVFEAAGLRVGVLICADVFDDRSYAALAELRPDVIAVPTNSPLRPLDPLEDKLARDEAYFAAGARVTGAIVVKACTIGGIYGRPAQGRSLVAGPEGVAARIAPEAEGREAHLIVEFPGGKLL
jgi:NAD+ synthase (glutamine-hydrolysing)